MCFEKFLMTATTVNAAVKELAYQNHSMLGYKAYPEHSITSAYYYDDEISFNLRRAPFVWNRDYAA